MTLSSTQDRCGLAFFSYHVGRDGHLVHDARCDLYSRNYRLIFLKMTKFVECDLYSDNTINVFCDVLESPCQLSLEEIGHAHTYTNVGCQVNCPK